MRDKPDRHPVGRGRPGSRSSEVRVGILGGRFRPHASLSRSATHERIAALVGSGCRIGRPVAVPACPWGACRWQFLGGRISGGYSTAGRNGGDGLWRPVLSGLVGGEHQKALTPGIRAGRVQIKAVQVALGLPAGASGFRTAVSAPESTVAVAPHPSDAPPFAPPGFQPARAGATPRRARGRRRQHPAPLQD